MIAAITDIIVSVSTLLVVRGVDLDAAPVAKLDASDFFVTAYKTGLFVIVAAFSLAVLLTLVTANQRGGPEVEGPQVGGVDHHEWSIGLSCTSKD